MNFKKGYFFIFLKFLIYELILILIIFSYYIFLKKYFFYLLNSDSVVLNIFNLSVDIAEKNLDIWIKIKQIFNLSNYFVLSLIFTYISYLIFKQFKYELNLKKKEIKRKNKVNEKNRNKKKNKNKKMYTDEATKEKLNILIGFNKDKEKIYLEEKGLFQNFLVTGSIGTGKTQSIMYPISEKLIEYDCFNEEEKIGMLILDVKGNFHEMIEKICLKHGRREDLIKIDLSGNIKYNPLDKPDLKPRIIANRLKTILELFSPETTESFWLDKCEQLLTEAIKYIRIYNEKYVDFNEISKLIFDDNYYLETKEKIKIKIMKKELNQEELYNLNTFYIFFENEFLNLDERTKSILKSEISRITNTFISDYRSNLIFSPKKDEINFKGFKEVINTGKIVVLNMNISENTILSKIIATYLKLDFQTEILMQLKENKRKRITAFLCDEYQEYVSKTDANFYSQSREAKCINIIATQSYSSIKNALKDKDSTEVIIQNLVNKIWLRTDDNYTIKSAVEQIGKINKRRNSKTISESSKESNYSYVFNKFISTDSNLSESLNTSLNLENMFENIEFSQKLKTFEAISFLSDGDKILKPEKIKLIPSFQRDKI